MTFTEISTLIIFGITYIALACDRLPKINVDRACIAFVGAVAILIFTPINQQTLAQTINVPILGLLLGMMMIVAYLNISGFFTLAIHWANKYCKSPTALLALIIFISGFLSAFLINDIICFALTPLVIQLCHKRQLPSLPFLIALSTAANIGSVATLTGNPQNMLIGNFCHISYLQFSLHTAPIAIIGLLIDYLLIRLLFHKSFSKMIILPPSLDVINIEKPWLLYKSITVTLIVIILFFTSIPLALTALGAAGLLILDNTSPKHIYRLIDWPLLIMFISLFILIGAMENNIMSHWHITRWHILQNHPREFISVAAIFLSNIVSNVPAVLLFKPIITQLPNVQALGINLAVMSTLAGNLTLLGSLANLIVVTVARKDGVNISFWQFFRLGLPLTFITLLIGYGISLFY